MTKIDLCSTRNKTSVQKLYFELLLILCFFQTSHFLYLFSNVVKVNAKNFPISTP